MHPTPMAPASVESICIRPGYAWPGPAAIREQLQRCGDEGWSAETNGRCMTALFSGCGPDGADVAVLASQLLAGAFSPAHWLEQQQQHEQGEDLAPSDIEFAFQQCHQQLLQLQQQQIDASAAQQQYQQQYMRQGMPPDNSSSTSSQPQVQQQQQQAACPDVNWSGTSALLVALDQARTKLLVASSGSCKAVLARSSLSGDLTVMELAPRLALGHDPQETARLDAAGSSIIYNSATTTTTSTPMVGGCAPPQHLGSGITANNLAGCSSCAPQQDAVLVGPDGQVLPGVAASRLLGFKAASAAGVVPEPVVTSWRLTGSESFVVLGSAGLWAAMSPAEVVDFVAAVLASSVCSLSSASAEASGGSNSSSTKASSADSSRESAHLPALTVGDLLTLEAQERLKLRLMDSLFGMCPGPAAAAAEAGNAAAAAPVGCGMVPDVTAVVLLLDGSRALRSVAVDPDTAQAEVAQVSRACRCNAEAQALQALWAASAFCCDRAVSGPPAPALSCLLPALSVAAHWPSSCWPHNPAVRTPARATALSGAATNANNDSYEVAGSAASSSSKMSLEDAAAAAGLLSRGGRSSRAAGSRTGFTLSPRLSCELDLSHDHASHGSCGCLAAVDCCGSALSSDSSPSEQSMIVHKVRLSGPCELESLLFGSATTSYPDTTVARHLRPRGATRSAGLYSAASATDVLSQGSFVSRNGWSEPGCFQAPKRSASVSMGILSTQHYSHKAGSINTFSSSSLFSPTQDSVAPRDAGLSANTNSASGSLVSPWQQQQRSSGGDSTHSMAPLEQQLAQLEQMQQQRSLRAAMSMPAKASKGYVLKARSYQALSALQAASASVAGIKAGSSLPIGKGSSCAELGAPGSSDDSSSRGMLSSMPAMGPRAEASASAGVQVTFRSAFAAPNAQKQVSMQEAAAVADRSQQAAPRRSSGMAAAADASDAQQPQQNLLQLLDDTPSTKDLPVLQTESCTATAHPAMESSDSEGKVRGGVLRGRNSSLLRQPLSQELPGVGAAGEEVVKGAAATATASGSLLGHSGSLRALAAAVDVQAAATGGRGSSEFSKGSTGSSGSYLSSSNLSSSGGSYGRTEDGSRSSAEWKSVLKDAAVKASSRATSAAQNLIKSSSRQIRRLSDTGATDDGSSKQQQPCCSESEGRGSSSGLDTQCTVSDTTAGNGGSYEAEQQQGFNTAVRGGRRLAGLSAAGPAGALPSLLQLGKKCVAAAAAAADSEQREPCVRGGRAKSARLRGCRSTPDLQQLAAESAGSDRRIRGGMQRNSSSSSSRSGRVSWDASGVALAVGAAAAGAGGAAAAGVGAPTVKLIRFDHQSVPRRPLHASQSTSALMRSRRRHSCSSTSDSSFTSNGSSSFSSAALGADPSFSTIVAPAAAAAAVGSAQRPAALQLPADEDADAAVAAAVKPTAAGGVRLSTVASPGAGAAAAAADAGFQQLSRNTSSCWSESSSAAACADGAVHGGELGEESLEGQMRGGKRSNSLTMSSSLLQSLSLPSSAAEDSDLQASCSSPVPPWAGSNSASRVGSAAAYTRMLGSSSSFGGSSSAPMYAAPPAASSARASFSSGVGPSFPFARQNASLGAAVGAGTAAAAAAAAMSAAAGSSQFGTAAADGGSNSSSSGIEVLWMPSGSFTRVKLAASAPAAPADGEDNTLGSALLLQQRLSSSCLQVQQHSSLHDSAVGGFSRVNSFSHDRHAVRRTHSCGAGSWGPGGAGGDARNAPAAFGSSGRWSASKAWTAGPGTNSGGGVRSSLSAFEVPGCRGSNQAAVAAAARAAAVDVWSRSHQQQPLISALGAAPPGPPGAAGTDRDPKAVRVSFGDSPTDIGSTSAYHGASPDTAELACGHGMDIAAVAAAAALLPGVKRQRSTPLPTLAESPAPTPGTSPQVGGLSYVASCAQYISVRRDPPDQHHQQQQQQQQQQQVGNSSNSSSSELADPLQASSLSHYHLAAAAAASSSSVEQSPEHSGGSLGARCCDHDALSLEEFLEGAADGAGASFNSVGRAPSFEFSRLTSCDTMMYESPAHVGSAVQS